MLDLRRVAAQHEMNARVFPVVARSFDDLVRAASTSALGGGITTPTAFFNAQVPDEYDGRCLDDDLARIASGLGFDTTATIGMLTAVDVRHEVEAIDGDVLVAATVGASKPTWAASPDEADGWAPGTINVVVLVADALDDAALVNAIATSTEAKVQALVERGVPGTGTASDAVAVVCSAHGASERFGGPRSRVGSSIARATHAAVTAGIDREQR